jgi:hypothetical protein
VTPIFEELVAELKAETDKLEKTLSTDLPTFNRMMQRMKREPVSEK